MTRLLSALAVCALALIASSACGKNPVGQKCFIGAGDADGGVSEQTGVSIIASPALECPSRECLRVPQQKQLPEGGEYADLCTAECSSDDDCDKVEASPCVTGFTCMIPVEKGPFCCRKKCVCKDYIIVPEGGHQTPAACDPANELNTCCNLEGRENLAACQ